jgi:hypothetical protein
MKKYLPNIAGVILGLLFIMASVVVLFHLIPPPKLPEGSLVVKYMDVMGPSGYMTFVKVCELIGGILVAIPKFRNFGLLILGPIIVNIIAYTAFIMNGEGLANPMLIFIVVLALYLLWTDRKAWAGLKR